jgi:hypothetical protein
MSFSHRIKYILYSVEMQFKKVANELNELQKTTLGILSTILFLEHGIYTYLHVRN